MKKVLIIEDDVNLGLPLMGVLEMLNYKVLHLTDGDNIMQDLLQFAPDIIILDVMLNAKLDGFQVAEKIRSVNNTPILFTTSRNGNEDFETAFSLSNIDYVRKPYRLTEVQMRMLNLLKRQVKVTQPNTEVDKMPIGKYCFYPLEQVLMSDFNKCFLNKNESAVLIILIKYMNRFVSREEIVLAVWNVSDPFLK